MSYADRADWRSYRDARRAERWERRRACGPFFHPVELVAMILGFIFFFPIGLAILFWRLAGRPDIVAPFRAWWSHNRPATAAGPRTWSPPFGGPRSFGGGFGGHSGNSAFEEYKARELERLEQERRKLAEEQKAFGEFVEELRRTKDREEFDRFMASRNAPPQSDAGPTSEPPPGA
jgi:hypothetical protein